MSLSVKALAITGALVWGGCLLLVGIAHLAFASYGEPFLQGVSSIYPGFHGARTAADVVIGTAYAAADGAIGGAVFAWLYNVVARRPA